MKLDIYLNFRGNCREAFRFYEQHLGARVTRMMTHGEGPHGAGLPSEQKDKVLHARMELGGTVVMGADIPNSEPMRSAYLTLTAESEQEAERVYGLLSDGGDIFMKMEQTFFANRFAQLRDRFGTSWMLLHEGSTGPSSEGEAAQESYALIVKHKTLPGRRDDVRAVWERHMAPAIAANPGHTAYFYCLDNADPDSISAFQEYTSAEVSRDFLETDSYAAYLKDVEPLLAGPPQVTGLTPVWSKRNGVPVIDGENTR